MSEPTFFNPLFSETISSNTKLEMKHLINLYKSQTEMLCKIASDRKLDPDFIETLRMAASFSSNFIHILLCENLVTQDRVAIILEFMNFNESIWNRSNKHKRKKTIDQQKSLFGLL